MRSTSIAVLAIVLIAGCSSSGSRVASTAPSDAPASQAPASQAAPPSASAAAAPSAAESDALAGVWRTDPVTKAAIVAAWQAAGMQKWIQPTLAKGIIGDTNVFTLHLADGRWLQYWTKDGGGDDVNDDGAYTIKGDTVDVRHGSDGSDDFGWTIDGDALRFTVIGDTFPKTDDVPESVFMTAFYAVAPYIRQP